MKQFRKYGKPPFAVAVIHGGPGARGEMAPVARKLSSRRGVIEPLQSALTIKGQVSELRDILERTGNPPITLIGFSWGAWLCFMYAAWYPQSVKKVILIGSGGFKEEYAARTLRTRLSRLTIPERVEVTSLIDDQNDHERAVDDPTISRMATLFFRTDAYDPIVSSDDEFKLIDFRPDLFKPVWDEAEKMRRDGSLLALGKYIRCSVTAIHGDYDPHPGRGVWEPLSEVLTNFRFILIERCGHKPWIEREARDHFFGILNEELQQ